MRKDNGRPQASGKKKRTSRLFAGSKSSGEGGETKENLGRSSNRDGAAERGAQSSLGDANKQGDRIGGRFDIFEGEGEEEVQLRVAPPKT